MEDKPGLSDGTVRLMLSFTTFAESLRLWEIFFSLISQNVAKEEDKFYKSCMSQASL